MPVKYAEKIMGILSPSSDIEWTIEANPGTLGPKELKDWRGLGLNRLSIGMQSFDDGELKFLGRIHSVSDSMKLFDSANDLGLAVNADFIYGLPNQKVPDIVKLCERINGLGLKSASLYELTPERDTKFQNMPPMSESLSTGMYSAIQNTLTLKRYEVSNYGIPCRHNMNVWSGEEYIGVGESAAGRIVLNGHWHETKIKNNEIVMDKLSDKDRSIELVMTGLRTVKGISRSIADKVVNMEFVERNPKYFILSPESVRMGDKGLLLLDGLMPNIIK